MYPHYYFSLRCYCCRPLLVSNKTAASKQQKRTSTMEEDQENVSIF